MSVRRPRGFSLIELLIGLTISLMGLAAVASMMMNFSKKRAGITQTLATQDNGVMALYRLERDISQAGYGLMNLQACATIANAVVGAGAGAAFTPYAVVINDGGVGVSDTITVKGTNPASGIPGTELDTSTGTSVGANNYNVRSAIGFAVNDLVVATNNCTLTRVTAVDTAATPNTISYTPAQAVSTVTGFLAYFGQPGAFFDRQYAVGPTALTVADYPAFVTNNLVDNIVFLKAQYGIAASITGTPVTVANWVSGATALTGTTCAVGGAVHPACVVALRVGVVAQSAVADNETVDQPNPLPVLPQATDSLGTAIGAAVTFAVPNTRMRYRAYSTIIPLKNVIWTR